MNVDEIDRVAVLGTGNMGHGITEVVALASYNMTMCDIDETEFVDEGYEAIEWSLEKLAEKEIVDEPLSTILDRIDTEVDLETAVSDADLVIEVRIVNEAAKLIGDDVATAEAIDTGLWLGAGFPEGPCRRADKFGLDQVSEKLEPLYEEYGEERYELADHLRKLIEDGWTGEEAGAGFYEYGEGT